MVVELKQEIKIIEREEKKILSKVYEFELSDEEITKFSSELKGVVDTCNNELKKLDEEHLEIAKTKVLKEADKELVFKQEAIKNFSKYKTETIIQFKKNSVRKLQELMDFCNPEVYKKYQQLLIEGMRKEFVKNVQDYKIQLKENKPLLKIYEDYLNGNKN